MGRISGVSTLVGRERELEQLDAALAELEQGTSTCIAVAGEPGIGKTRLLHELGARAEQRGHLVLMGSAAEFESELPFAVWADALDAYVASQELGMENELATELGGILPSLGVDAGGSVADERFRIHQATRRLLTLLSDKQALVLVLDDLHWSDPASLELLTALVRRGPAACVLLVFAFRPGQASERLTAALAAPDLMRIDLEQLSEQDSGKLLGSLEPAAAEAIYRHGGGNPFYLEQLARASQDGRLPASLAGADGRAGGVPAAVTSALAEELASLPAPARSLLDAAAVAGEPFELDLAAAVAGLQTRQALDALDELLSLDLVRATDVPRRFVFRHPIVRSAVYESTRAGWRIAAHQAAAEALEARGAGPAERAHHVEQCASPGDENAISLLIAAGDATAGHAPAAAAGWFEAALRLLPAVDIDRQIDMRLALASAQRSTGELERCRRTLLEATALLPPEAGARRIELTALCAAVEHWLGRHEEAHRRLAHAWEQLDDRSTAEAAALQMELAVDGLYEMDFSNAQSMSRAALETARTLGDRALVAAAASALALSEVVVGKMESARRHRDEAVELIDRLSDEELAPRLDAMYYLAWAESYLELPDESIAHADRGIAVARATGEGRLLVPLMLTKGYPFEAQGRLAEARETCTTAVEIARVAGNPHYLFWALFELGWALYYSGRIDEAIEACEESLRAGGSLTRATMPSAGGGPGWLLAVCRFEAGDPEAMLATVGELGDENLDWAIPVEQCYNWEVLAVAELALGRPDAAEAYARRAEETAASLGSGVRLPAALAARTRAIVLLADGDVDGAVRLAEESVTGTEAARAPLQTTFSRHLLGRALVEKGERLEAIAILREAERELDACGCFKVRDEIRRELRRLGARAEPRGPAAAGDSGLAALTKREREIADLVTDRLTNKQIAAQLFLSDKTIESHVRNIFMKLGASSRVEVARVVERERREQAAPVTQ